MTPDQFKAARLSLAETQTSLGQFLGIAPRHIRRYETGEQKIPRAISILMKMLVEREASKIKRHARYEKKKAAKKKNDEIWKKVMRVI